MLKLCENGSNIDKFGFEKSHGKQNFGFDLLALVQFGFLKTETEPKFGFCTSLLQSNFIRLQNAHKTAYIHL